MIRTFVPLAAAALVLGAAAGASAQVAARDNPAPHATGTGIIRGRVTLAGSTDPLPRVTVRASSPALPGAPRVTKTDSAGRYELTELPAGKYVVSTVKPNFVTTTFGQRRPGGPGVPFDVADGHVTAKVDLAMARAGVITGRVVDEVGDPVTDAQVVTLRYQYVGGERRLMPAGGHAPTNDIGEFRLFGLAPGEYVVAATLRNFVVGDRDDRGGYAMTYYPGTGNPAEAQRISIEPGQIVSDISLALQPVRTVKVSGVLLDAAGRPIPNVMVLAVTRDMAVNPGGTTGPTKPDGRFTVSGLTPGEYTLRANHPVDGGVEIALMPIATTDSDIADVQLIAVRQSTITGHVTFDGPAAPPKASAIRVNYLTPDPRLGNSATASPKDDFSFELKAIPGRGVIRASAGADWGLARVLQNGVDVTDSGIELPPDGVSSVTVELTNKQSSVAGVVAGEDGTPQRDCWVIVFAQEPQRWTPQTRYVSATRPGQDNQFRAKLAPAAYYAVALPEGDVEVGEWTDPAFLTQLRERALPFTLGTGEQKSLDLKLAPRVR